MYDGIFILASVPSSVAKLFGAADREGESEVEQAGAVHAEQLLFDFTGHSAIHAGSIEHPDSAAYHAAHG